MGQWPNDVGLIVNQEMLLSAGLQRKGVMREPQDAALTMGRVQDLVASFLRRHPQQQAAFMADPAGALTRHLGIAVDGSRVVAVADTASTVHVVIPPDPDELGDRTLDRVAGGLNAMTSSRSGDSATAPIDDLGRYKVVMPFDHSG